MASDTSGSTKTVTLTDMGEPADLANGLAVLRHIAEHGESFVRSGEASALLAEIGRLREIESCGDLLRLAPEPRDDWQPIKTAPKDGRWLVLGSHTDCFMGFWDGLNSWCDQRDNVRDPTHWMPLPARPNALTKVAVRQRWESTGLCGCTGELTNGERPFACEHGFKTELQNGGAGK